MGVHSPVWLVLPIRQALQYPCEVGQAEDPLPAEKFGSGSVMLLTLGQPLVKTAAAHFCGRRDSMLIGGEARPSTWRRVPNFFVCRLD